jgi:hypothetical protein
LDPGSIGIGTNCEGLVSVEVQIWSSEPAVVTESWDHVVECGIDVPSGRLVVAGCCDDTLEDSFGVALSAGNYTARVCYGNQYECGDGEPTCTGEYLIMLWPSQENVLDVEAGSGVAIYCLPLFVSRFAMFRRTSDSSRQLRRVVCKKTNPSADILEITSVSSYDQNR